MGCGCTGRCARAPSPPTSARTHRAPPPATPRSCPFPTTPPADLGQRPQGGQGAVRGADAGRRLAGGRHLRGRRAHAALAPGAGARGAGSRAASSSEGRAGRGTAHRQLSVAASAAATCRPPPHPPVQPGARPTCLHCFPHPGAPAGHHGQGPQWLRQRPRSQRRCERPHRQRRELKRRAAPRTRAGRACPLCAAAADFGLSAVPPARRRPSAAHLEARTEATCTPTFPCFHAAHQSTPDHPKPPPPSSTAHRTLFRPACTCAHAVPHSK